MAPHSNHTDLGQICAEDVILAIDTVAPAETSEPASPLPVARLVAFKLVIVLGVVILVAGLWHLQFVDGQKYQTLARENMVRVLPILPQRGVIYDRNNIELIRNTPRYAITIAPSELPHQHQTAVLDRLQRVLHLSASATATISQSVTAHRAASAYIEVPVATNVPRDVALLLAERRQDLPGVVVEEKPAREYLTGDLMTHILGYVGRISDEEYRQKTTQDPTAAYRPNDTIGKAGLELSYEPQLRGRPGDALIEVNSSGDPVRTLPGGVAAVPGSSLRLSIDLSIQTKMMEIARRESARHDVVAIVIMNPQNGQILALADWPSFDNNFFSGPISPEHWADLTTNPHHPLLNHAIAGQYPPGSTFKIISAAAALYYHVIDGQTMLTARPWLYVPNQYYPNRWDLAQRFYDPGVPGPQNVVDALAHSSNSFFYQVAGGSPDAASTFTGLGYQRLDAYAHLFNLGGLTGIDLPGEVTGILPDEAWKQAHYGADAVWTKGDTYLMGIGQGYVTATPIQMAVAVAAIANGGTVYQPQIVQDVLDANGRVVQPFQPKVVRRLPNTPEQLQLIRDGMRKNMTWSEGTAVQDNVPEIYLAGKTGSAEYGAIDPTTGKYLTSHGWFVSFASRDAATPPQYATCVFVENGLGATDAGRITQEIMRYLYNLPAAPRK